MPNRRQFISLLVDSRETMQLESLKNLSTDPMFAYKYMHNLKCAECRIAILIIKFIYVRAN